MNRKTRTLLSIITFVLALVVIYFVYDSLTDNYDNNKIAEQKERDAVEAADFKVYDVDGNEVRLSDFRGQPVVVNFWASWCPPCVKEMPDFEEVYQEVGDEVVFMMVNLVGQRETKEKGLEFIEGNGFTFPVYFDMDQEAAYTYRVASIPSTYFINADGNIVESHIGLITKNQLESNIELIR